MIAPGLVRRVLMTTDTVGGVFHYAVQLSSALRRHGMEVVLATMGAPLTAGQLGMLNRIDGLTLFESRFRLEWMDDCWDDVDRAGEWLLDIERQTRPDVVHLNGYAHGALPWKAPSVVVGHSCVLSWWAAVRREAVPDRYGEYRRRVARGLRGTAMLIAPSRSMLRALLETYGVLPGGRVIYNGQSSEEFAAAGKEPFIFSMGRLWDEAKNVAALDAAAAHLRWPVVVAGSDGADRRVVNGLSHLRALGWLDADGARAVLARASIYALPARYEPFGLSVLEAALAGCALVLGDIASLREIWGDAAVFVDPDDDLALARELDALIVDPARRSALAARARRRALSYTPERMVTGYLDAYREALTLPHGHFDHERTVCA